VAGAQHQQRPHGPELPVGVVASLGKLYIHSTLLLIMNPL
jgi:hypothetical protein